MWNLSNVNKKDIRTKSLTSFWCVYCWNCVNFTPCSGVSIELYELCFWNFSRIFYPFAKSSVILRHFYVILRHFWEKLHKVPFFDDSGCWPEILNYTLPRQNKVDIFVKPTFKRFLNIITHYKIYGHEKLIFCFA